MIRILIAEDSNTVRELLHKLVSADSQIIVVGLAKDGAEALALTEQLHPDVILMDILMPGINGIQAAAMIMKSVPTPIVMISAVTEVRDSQLALDAFDAGVMAVLNKPPGPDAPGYKAAANHIISTLKAIAAVKIRNKQQVPLAANIGQQQTIRLIAIAASVGGPAALQTLFSQLNTDLGVPVLVVQHIAQGFVTSLVTWLQNSSDLPISIALNGEHMQPGHIYFAPDNCHLAVSGNHIYLNHGAAIKGFRPSASALFKSVGTEFKNTVAAVILTGMGDDGVEGLKIVKQFGGLVIAQDQASSVVFGMNGQAVAKGLVDTILPLGEIAALLTSLAQQSKRGI